MKKIEKLLSVILLVALCVVTLTSCGQQGTPEPTTPDEPTLAPTEPAATKPNQVIIGTDTEANGDWAYGAFTSSINATDQDVLTLTDDMNTVTSNFGGDYVINESVVDSYERTEDADGNVTYTFKIKQGLVFNNGDPVKAENFLAWPLFTLSAVGKEAGTTASSWDYLPGGKDYREGTVDHLEGLRLLGEYEFSQTIMATGYSGQSYLPYYYELAFAGAQAVNLDY